LDVAQDARLGSAKVSINLSGARERSSVDATANDRAASDDVGEGSQDGTSEADPFDGDGTSAVKDPDETA
jgi:hypothetical protein